MDKKKLIGTIIGVIAFGVLIAAATYAWLIYGFNATNGTYSLGSMNFNVSFTRGTDVANVPIVNSPTTSNASSLNVQAYKVSGSAPGTLTIYLNTTSATSALLTSGALHYAACESTACPSDLTQVSSSTSGTITATGKKALLTDELSATSKTYYVYFWLDSEDVDDNVIGSSYSGYISAEAIQTDSDNS